MTSRQRFFDAFFGRGTDRVAVAHIGFSSRAASRVLGREAYVGGGVQQWREATALWNGPDAHREFLERSAADAFALTQATGQDLYRWEYWRMPQRPIERRDEYTYVFGDRADKWVVRRYDPDTEMFPIIEWGGEHEKPPQSMEDLERIVEKMEREQAEKPEDLSAVTERARQILAAHPDYAVRFHAGYCGLPYEEPAWLEATLERPDLVERYMQVQASGEIRRIEALAAAGVKLMFGGGDFASNTGPFYSPQVFRDLVLPHLKQLADACHRAGAYLLFASDGNLWPVADDLFGRSGLDGYYEIDRLAGMDVRKLRQRFPNLSLVGANVSSITLSSGTPQQVIDEVRDCMEAARELGRIIVGISNYATPETPPENVDALLEAVERYR